MIPELLPQRQTTVSSVRYAADRLQTDVRFTDEALGKIANVPRIFLPTVLKNCVKWAEENNVKVIDVKEMEIINDKRSKEKSWATPHDPCASVCAASTGVEAQIFVRLLKFDAGLRAKCASLCATSRRIDVIFDDVGNHDGNLASR